MEAKETKMIIQQMANSVDEIKCPSQPHLGWMLALTYHYSHIHREPANTTLTIMALTRGSIHQSQHFTKGSTQGNGGLVLSRQDLYQMEIYWRPLVDIRKT